MKATERTLSQILHSPDQYVIPVFQRYYSWGPGEWQTLWDDLRELLDPEVLTKRHFLGSVVVVAEDHTPGVTPSYQVIDGQQRLATLSLLLCALRDRAKDQSAEGLAEEVQENYLVHKFKKRGDRQRYKVYPRFRDREDYLALTDGEAMAHSGEITSAYKWFWGNLGYLSVELEREDVLRELFTAITSRLDFVMITLDRHENVYKIFSSLNSKGLPLDEADLIRNHVFMNVPIEEQDNFDERYWRPLEAHFESGGNLDGHALTGFFRDVLMSGGRYVGKSDTYGTFQRTIGPRLNDPRAVAEDFLRQVEHYDILRGRRSHSVLAIDSALQRVRELETTTTYPLLLALLDRQWKGEIGHDELANCFQMVASFILRRYICMETSRPYSKWFVAAAGELGSSPVGNLVSFLKRKHWPQDDRFKAAFTEFRLYGSAYARQVLVALELAIPHKERADLSNAQVEHVMPQTLTEEWKEMVGESWQEDYWKWADTPGNLTLTAYNQTLGNRSFPEKKEEFGRSNILLNRYFRSCEAWTKKEIEDRGRHLAEIAARIWISPPQDPTD